MIKEKSLGLDTVGYLTRTNEANELTLNFNKYNKAVSVVKV